MKMLAAAVPLEIAKHDEQGRRMTDVAEKQALIVAYEASGMTQRAFARRKGINYFTFATWLRKKRMVADKLTKGPRFMEIGLGPSTGFALEVVLPDGMLIRGTSSSEVAALAKALR